MVQRLLLLVKQIQLLLIVMGQKLHRQMVVVLGQFTHLEDHGACPFQSY